jgi:hypothetical protein
MNRSGAVLSQWASASEKSIRRPRKRFRVPFLYEGGTIVCVLDYTSLWFVLKRDEFKVAIRACFDGQGIDSARMVTSNKNGCSFLVEGRTGRFAINVEVLKEDREILRYKTTITPRRPVQMTGSPRDLLLGGHRRTKILQARFTSLRRDLLLRSPTPPFAIRRAEFSFIFKI